MRKKRGIGLLVSAVIIVILLLFFSLLYIGNNKEYSQSTVDKTTDSADTSQSTDDNTADSTDTSQSTDDNIADSADTSQSTDDITEDSTDTSQSTEDNIADSTDTSQSTDDNIADSTDTSQSTDDITEDSSEIQSAVVENKEFTFRTQELYDSHFIKHGAEFGVITQTEYLQKANDLIHGANVITKNDVDGDLIYYSESLNEFLVLSTDGYIRTFFRPDDGIDYFNRQ